MHGSTAVRLVSGCVLFLPIINIAPTYEHSGKSSVKKVRAPDLKKKKKKRKVGKRMELKKERHVDRVRAGPAVTSLEGRGRQQASSRPGVDVTR